ncbi:MAG: hypothetical protein AAGG48_31635 [Planctomycetota bacterium]
MPWFYLDITDSEGHRYRDEIRAFKEPEARVTVENLGFSINQIRMNRLKTFATCVFEGVDQRIRPYKYDYIRQLEDLGIELASFDASMKQDRRRCASAKRS